MLKQVVQQILNHVGIRISRIDRRQVPDADRLKWLRDLPINTIVDIGANKGGFSFEFHRLFPNAQIYAFEPLADCYELARRKMMGIENFHAFNLALGDAPGSTQMQRSSYSGSSSILQMADLHKELFPVTAGQRGLEVPVDTLDHALSGYALSDDVFIKIDVQGFEDKVIAGGFNIFARARIVLVETSFYELYKGQPLFDGVYQLLKGLGFEYHGSWAPELKSPIDGRPLQQDSVFVRPAIL